MEKVQAYIMLGGEHPKTIIGIAGAALVTITGAVLAFKKYMSEQAVARAANTSEEYVITMLRKQIELDQERINKLSKALDDANTELTALRSEMQEMTLEVSKWRNIAEGEGGER